MNFNIVVHTEQLGAIRASITDAINPQRRNRKQNGLPGGAWHCAVAGA